MTNTLPTPAIGKQTDLLEFPVGLLGFENFKRFELIRHPAEEPFLWLREAGPTGQAFLVVPPGVVVADYQPQLSPTDVKFLDLRAPGEALVFNIVTLHPDGRATVNLKGPIVINARAQRGIQIVPENAAEFSTQHPLPVATA